MSFSIENFKNATAGGLAKPSKYRATIFFAKLNMFATDRLSILCESAVLPSRSFRTESEYLYGISRKIPLGVTYDDFSLGFICTRGMPERYLFDRWTSFISNPTSYYMHYFDDYKANIQVECFNDDGTTSYTILIEEAYPLNVNLQQLSYSETDSYLKLQIDFAYTKWRNNREVAEGDQMQQGYLFQPHIQPVANNNVLSSEWSAPDTLNPQQTGDWNDLSSNPWYDVFTGDNVQTPVGNSLQNSADVISEPNNLISLPNQESQPVSIPMPWDTSSPDPLQTPIPNDIQL